MPTHEEYEAMMTMDALGGEDFSDPEKYLQWCAKKARQALIKELEALNGE